MFRRIISSLRNRGEMSPHPNRQSNINPSKLFHTDWNANHDWHSYTRNRFLMNEARELRIRRANFNMNELAKCAAEAVGCTFSDCVHIEKFSDGMFNKAFLFTMQDGTQVVGKVPNPNAGRPHYTTASEVATMDFVSRPKSLQPSNDVSNAQLYRRGTS